MASRGDFRGRGAPYRGRGGGDFGNRRGHGNFQPAYGPPAQVLELGSFLHACEGEIVCESNNPKIPYFNAPIYLENKTAIGKIDEILGPINQVFFTVKPQEGIQAASFKSGDKFYIGGDKLLPLEKFLPKPKPLPGAAREKKAGGAARGGGRGRGAPRGRGSGRGAPRGRGGFSDRGTGRGRGFGSGSFPPGRGVSKRGYSSRGGTSSRGGSRGRA